MSAFVYLMMFYALVASVISPVIGYYSFGRRLSSAGNGFVAGSVLNLCMWFAVGRKMAMSG